MESQVSFSTTLLEGTTPFTISNGGVSAKFGNLSASLNNNLDLTINYDVPVLNLSDEWMVHTGLKKTLLYTYGYTTEVFSPKGTDFAVIYETYYRYDRWNWRGPAYAYGAAAAFGLACAAPEIVPIIVGLGANGVRLPA